VKWHPLSIGLVGFAAVLFLAATGAVVKVAVDAESAPSVEEIQQIMLRTEMERKLLADLCAINQSADPNCRLFLQMRAKQQAEQQSDQRADQCAINPDMAITGGPNCRVLLLERKARQNGWYH
jgi:hypothetical protein